MKKKLVLLIIIILPFVSTAQKDSTEKQNPTLLQTLIVPSSLAATGLLIYYNEARESDHVGLHFSPFYEELDKYLQLAPILGMYTADIFKVPSKSNVKVQTKNLLVSEMAMGFIVIWLKKQLKTPRPNGLTESFPSGHMAQAVVASHIMYTEYKDSNALLAYSAYLPVVGTGAMRLLNKTHRVSDLLVGAAIGMAITNIVYYIDPLGGWKMFQDKEQESKVSVIPMVNDSYLGASFSYKF